MDERKKGVEVKSDDKTKTEPEVESGAIPTSERTSWSFNAGAVHLFFPLDAVSERVSIGVHRWKVSDRSPRC